MVREANAKLGYAAAPWGEDVAMAPAKPHWSFDPRQRRALRVARKDVKRALRLMVEREVLAQL